MSGGMIRILREGPVGTILLDNPARKNAVTAGMWRAIPDAVRWLVVEGGARVIILSGAGETDFSAGADISEFSEVRRDAETARIYEAENSAAFTAIRTAPVPVIARIRGICYGGGFGLAAASDLRLAEAGARFAIPPARLGLAYPADAVGDILRALGDQMARHALYTGEVMRAVDLAAGGFLLECPDADRLDARVDELARTIAANAPLSVRASKLAIRAFAENSDTAAQDAAALGAATFDSEDYAEGRRAFAERRRPQFTGR
jgi:enoyl-CoA hydratase/carnithine racemase